MSIIEEIYQWNKERGLLDRPNVYNQTLESSFIAEELSELLRTTDPVEMVDAHIDSVFFQIGALCKLLGSPEIVHKAFNVVIEANKQKSNALDSEGKIIKDKTSFIEPQEAIKALLDDVVPKTTKG